MLSLLEPTLVIVKGMTKSCASLLPRFCSDWDFCKALLWPITSVSKSLPYDENPKPWSISYAWNDQVYISLYLWRMAVSKFSNWFPQNMEKQRFSQHHSTKHIQIANDKMILLLSLLNGASLDDWDFIRVVRETWLLAIYFKRHVFSIVIRVQLCNLFESQKHRL